MLDIKELKSYLDDLEFEPNELAYLMLTSKSENNIRDRLAYSIQKSYSNINNKILIGREYPIQYINSHPRLYSNTNRKKSIIDMVAMEFRSFGYMVYHAIVEFSCEYTTGVLVPKEWNDRVSKKIEEDFHKNLPFVTKLDYQEQSANLYQVLFVTDFTLDSSFNDKIEDSYFRYVGLVKYLFDTNTGINGGLYKKLQQYNDLRNPNATISLETKLRNAIEETFPNPYYIIEYGQLNKGNQNKYYEFDVKVYYYIIQKKTCTCGNNTECKYCIHFVADTLTDQLPSQIKKR